MNDVSFISATAAGAGGQILVTITSDTDTLGWRRVDDPSSTFHALTLGTTGTTAITPDASGFVLVAQAMIPGGVTTTFASNVAASDGESHFAFFAATPKPGTMTLLGLGLVTIGFWRSRRKS